MNMLKLKSVPDKFRPAVGLFNEFNWVSSLLTDVTEDFISVTKVDGILELEIKLSVIKNHAVTEIFLYSIKHGDELRLPLEKTCHKSHDIWRVKVVIENEAMLNPFSYRFKIFSGEQYLFLDSQGTYKYSVSNSANFKYFYNTSAPKWLESAVVYHVFIDRFKKSLPAKAHEVCWRNAPTGGVNEFYGGDILGIIDRLDYLQDLGINTLCLTPIFTSSTNHKYDVEDYFCVDESLGGNDAFIALAAACKSRNIKIILDGVFNHVSGRSEWFNKDSLHAGDGAYQNENSTYSDFFSFNKHPEQYQAFWGDKYLPKLNYQSSALRNIAYKNDNSIIKYWMQEPYGIDGWRLDACCMIGKYDNVDVNAEVLTELYAEAKASKKDCYIFGENPFDPSEVVQYKHLDGITNYSGFYSPLVYWLDDDVDFNACDMDSALKEFRALVGFQFANSSKNFIGNHDKQRLYSALHGDEEKYFTALTFLFTYMGVPALYYGEEIGLHDERTMDDSRICMNWDSWTLSNQTIFNFTKSLIRLYKASSALQKGLFRTLHTENNIFIYERFLGDELVVVVLNNSDRIVDSIIVETHSINRLAINTFNSCLDHSLKIVMLGSNVVEIKNISNKNPIILASRVNLLMKNI